MSTPRSAAQILMAGGALGRTGKKGLLCEAFNEAAKTWCTDHKNYEAAMKANGGKPPPGVSPPGKFNDRFYGELKHLDSTYANTVGREVPALFQAGAPVGGGLGQVSTIAGSSMGGLAGQTARALNTRWTIAGVGGRPRGTTSSLSGPEITSSGKKRRGPASWAGAASAFGTAPAEGVLVVTKRLAP